MKLSRRLANLNWIATVLTPVAIVMMEVYWFYPWLVWIGKWEPFGQAKTPLTLGAVIFLMGGAFAVTKYLLRKDWSLDAIKWGVIISGMLVVFTVLRSEYDAGYELADARWFTHTGQVILDSFTKANPIIIALPAAAYLWWRGISRGRTPQYVGDIYRTLLVGVGSFVLLIIVWRVSMGEGSLEALASTVAPDVAAFFFFALAGMALANLQGIQKRALPGESVRSFNRRWVPVLLAVVGGIVLVAVGVSALFSPEFMGFLGRMLNSIFDVLRIIVSFILIPLGYIAAALVYVGMWLINLLRRADPPQFPTSPFGAGEEELEEVPKGDPIPEAVILVLKWVLFAIAVIVVAWLVSRAVSRFRASRARTDVDEFNESLWSWAGFRADLAMFLNAIWQRLWPRRKSMEAERALPYWREEEDEPEGRLGIRDIYRRLLWQAFRFGVPHRGYETPFEYQGRLGPRIPENDHQLGELTDLYVSTRYGDIQAGERQVDRANSLWRTVRETLRRPERDRPREGRPRPIRPTDTR